MPDVSATTAVLLALLVAIVVRRAVRDPFASPRRLPTSSRLDHSYVWTTLGTNSGPIPQVGRSEPANLLWNDHQAVLVDVGEGTARQLVAMEVALTRVHTVLISHLHIDHTGGLYHLLGARLQTAVPTPLTIIGPPGTRATVDGIMQSLAPLRAFLFKVPKAAARLVPTVPDPDVLEVRDGGTFHIGTDGDIAVSAVANSHLRISRDDEDFDAFQSLSFRFDMADRSIVYTGDTGPCDAVTALARGADLLVSEITDVDQVVADLQGSVDLPRAAVPFLKRRFGHEHLTAEALAGLAEEAGVASVVVTHNPLTPASQRRAADVLARRYDGPVAFARDLESW